jgi:hypothetical protein
MLLITSFFQVSIHIDTSITINVFLVSLDYLDCQFLIAPSVFSNIYLLLNLEGGKLKLLLFSLYWTCIWSLKRALLFLFFTDLLVCGLFMWHVWRKHIINVLFVTFMVNIGKNKVSLSHLKTAISNFTS